MYNCTYVDSYEGYGEGGIRTSVGTRPEQVVPWNGLRLYHHQQHFELLYGLEGMRLIRGHDDHFPGLR